jgi:hypothetical protein
VREKIRSLYGQHVAGALVHENPVAVLEDRDLPYSPEPISPQKKEKSLTIKMPFFSRSKK